MSNMDEDQSKPLPEIWLGSLSYSVQHYLDGWRKGKGAEGDDPFDLEAPYQRASVWTMDQKQALIKSLLMNVPVGTLIISALPFRSGGKSWRVVDGKQRIEAVRAFFNDEVPTPRWWWQPLYLADPDGTGEVYHCDLSAPGDRMFQNRVLPGFEFRPEISWSRDQKTDYKRHKRTDEEILKAEADLYLLINGGGTAQTDEDMANAARVAGEMQS